MPVPMMASTGGGIIGKISRAAFGAGVDRNYYANPKVNQVLKTITDAELYQMSRIMASTMMDLISGSTTKTNRNGRTSMSLTVTQRASIANTVKSQKSLASLNKSTHRIH
jgi:hypothetical protein